MTDSLHITVTRDPGGVLVQQSAWIDSHDGIGFVTFINDGRGTLVRIYHPKIGTVNLNRLARHEVADLGHFLLNVASGLRNDSLVTDG